MATFVVLKTSLSATTASFFAALSTASSLRLAVLPTQAWTTGLHPPSRPSPEPGSALPETRGARRHLEACPPEALRPAGCRGSNQTAHTPLTESDAKRNPVFTRLCRPCD